MVDTPLIKCLQVAMAIGSRCACILDMKDGRVTHVFSSPKENGSSVLEQHHEDEGSQITSTSAQHVQRPVWLCSGRRAGTLLLSGGDWSEKGEGITMLSVEGRSAVDGVAVMKREHVKTPGRVTALCAHPSDPSLSVGFKVCICAQCQPCFVNISACDDDSKSVHPSVHLSLLASRCLIAIFQTQETRARTHYVLPVTYCFLCVSKFLVAIHTESLQ